MAIPNRPHRSDDNDRALDVLPDRLLYPVKESRQLLGGIAQSTFYRLVNEQHIRLIKLGRRTYVPRAEILRIVNGGDA